MVAKDAGIAFLKAAFGARVQAVYRDDAGAVQHAQLLIGGGP
jgi:hypothetical protein